MKWKWPPNKAWTSSTSKFGFRHFELIDYGGKGEKRWVELFAVLDHNVRIKVPWSELKNLSIWTSGWLQLPKKEE